MEENKHRYFMRPVFTKSKSDLESSQDYVEVPEEIFDKYCRVEYTGPDERRRHLPYYTFRKGEKSVRQFVKELADAI